MFSDINYIQLSQVRFGTPKSVHLSIIFIEIKVLSSNLSSLKLLLDHVPLQRKRLSHLTCRLNKNDVEETGTIVHLDGIYPAGPPDSLPTLHQQNSIPCCKVWQHYQYQDLTAKEIKAWEGNRTLVLVATPCETQT